MKKQLSIRMDEDIIKRLRIKVLQEDTNITDVVTDMVLKYLEDEKEAIKK